MKATFLSPLLALCLLLGGCGPEERIWWSPNGQEAAVLVGGALYLVKPDGALGDPLTSGIADKSATPSALSWLPDGSGFVLCRQRKIARWAEMAKLLPPQEASKVELLARAMPTLLEGAEKLAGQPSDVEALLASLSSGDPDDFLNALLCAFQNQKKAVKRALLKLPKGAELVAELNGDSSRFTLYEICLIKLQSGREDGAPKSLARSLYVMAQPRVSPGQTAVGYIKMQAQSPSVQISSLDGGEQLAVCESATFDWSPDGRSIVFAAPVGEKDGPLKNIRKVTVIQESGALMKRESDAKAPDAMPPPVDLAMALLPDPPRLQALPDGRVLFASQAATFPAAGAGPESDQKLYVVSEDGKKIEAIATAPGALPASLSCFVASPDGKLAAVVDGANDAVAVVDLASGVTEVVSPAHPDWHCTTIPAWRSSAELSFAALDKPDGSPAWMLWSKAGGVRSISGKWPAQATGDWLKKDDKKVEPSGPSQ
ncbi:MAG: hypothetical protein WCQ16_06825 [Verrucomicrobiae bacterium]